MTTHHQYIIKFFCIALFMIGSITIGWAQSDLDSSRIRSLQIILPYLTQMETMKEAIRKDTATFIGMRFFLDIDQKWLQQARFGTSVPTSWTGHRKGNSADAAIDVFPEYAHYNGKLCKVLAFFDRQDVAVMLLNVPGKQTIIVLNRGKELLNPNGVSVNMSLFAISDDQPIVKKRPAMAKKPTLKGISSKIQGEFITTERQTIVGIWRTKPLLVLKDSVISVLDRDWKVYTANEILVPGETSETMHRILAFDQSGTPAYFTLRKIGSNWRLTIKLEQSDKLGQDFFQFQVQNRAKHLRHRYIRFAFQCAFVVLIWFAVKAGFENQKLSEQRDRANLALSGLRARLNPHFLFNTLGSIQDLIDQQKYDSVNCYFSEMALLMRYVVDSAAQEYVPLKDELEALRKYCTLEALRTPFDFSIQVDPQVDLENVEIPTMLLQPFVENAILHGLRPSNGLKNLTIKVEQRSPQLLNIAIEDSGIGIEEAQRRQQNRDPDPKRGHQGMTMTNQRIDWLNVGKSEKIALHIQDRNQISPAHTGTLVQLSIPL